MTESEIVEVLMNQIREYIESDDIVQKQMHEYLQSDDKFLGLVEDVVRIRKRMLSDKTSSKGQLEILEVVTNYVLESIQAKMLINSNAEKIKYLLSKFTIQV